MSMTLELIPIRLRVGVPAAAFRAALQLPHAAQRLLAGAPIRTDGQELALEAQLIVRLLNLVGQAGVSSATPEQARLVLREALAAVETRPLVGVETTEYRIPTPSGDLGARHYRPHELTVSSELMVFYHGGGFVLGDLDSHDDVCRFLAKHAGIRVLSVDYRLAPEHAFPAAVDDAIEAFRHAVDHAGELGGHRAGIAVGGDSAGGNLAAVVAHHATHHGPTKPMFQLLLYPAADATVRRRSRETFGDGFLLTDGDMDWFLNHYEPDQQQRDNPRLSVLLAEDLSGLPPAHVVTAGFDPLRDEGEAYARRLAEFGVPVVARRFPDLVHGFANLRQAGGRFEEALFETVGVVRASMALHSPSAEA